MEQQKKAGLLQEQWEQQQPYIERVRAYYADRKGDESPLCYVRTYGCQQNVADSERMKGMLADMGFAFTETPDNADLILFNTCAVREHAEDRVFGNVGALKNIKRRRPHTLIGLCGCMVQQEHIAEKLQKSYPFVGLIFGTHVLQQLPQLLWQALRKQKRVVAIPAEDEIIAEGYPVQRDSRFKAWLPIMYGCNNFCTYCVVPYVRGRERSRDPDVIVQEARELVAQGYKEITLLGQNVNSYGKGEAHGVNFPELLRRINAIEGDFLIRFMTSHPKDATHELFDTIAACEKVSRHFHLPFQSGSNRVLKEMNRRYTRQQYLDLVNYAKRVMPGLVLTSDVIIGFPGETEAEAMDTVSLVEEVGFDALFTFIYSPRPGTKAAAMPDPATRAEKQKWFDRLLEVQNNMSAKLHAAYVGKTVRVLVDGESDDPEYPLTSRTEGNRLVRLKGDKALIGQFADVAVTGSNTWALYGEAV